MIRTAPPIARRGSRQRFAISGEFTLETLPHDRHIEPQPELERPENVFRKQGRSFWIAHAGKTICLRATKGLMQIQYLLGVCGRGVPAVELATIGQNTAQRGGPGDNG